MTVQYRIGGTLLTNRVTFPGAGTPNGIEGLVSAAYRGELGMGGVLIDDPLGDLTITGWQTFTVDDTDATPTRVWTGYIAERDMGRGGKYVTGTARVHNCDLHDLNDMLQLQVLRANAAKRGAESDVARVQWLLTSEALSGLVYDEGLVGTAFPINFLETEGRRRYANSILMEMAPIAAKNFYVYYDTTAARAALVWQPDTTAYWASTIAISNDDADVDNNTVFAPSQETTVQRQPNDQYGGVSFGWKGNVTYAQSATTIANMGLLRDAVYDTDRIGLQATAEAEAVSYLNVHANEADLVTTTLRLPSTHVNYVYAGQEINLKLVNVPGYETAVMTRVRRRDPRPAGPGWWDVHLELWVPPTPGDDAAAPACPDITQVALTDRGQEIVFATDVSDGVILLAWVTCRCELIDGVEVSPWQPLSSKVTATGSGTGRWYWRSSTGGGTAGSMTDFVVVNTATAITGYETNVLATTFDPANVDVYEVTEHASSTSINLGAVADPTTGQIILYGSLYGPDDTSLNQATPGTGWTIDQNVFNTGAAYKPWHLSMTWDDTTIPLTGNASVPNSTIYGGVMLQYGTCDATSLPFPGDPVGPETPTGTIDGSNTDFTVAGPFLPNTLRVLHDGIDQTSHVSASDTSAGTYTLDYAPSPGSTLENTYESA